MKKYLLLMAILLVSLPSVADDCSEMASTFSEEPDSMAADQLSDLNGCVTRMLISVIVRQNEDTEDSYAGERERSEGSHAGESALNPIIEHDDILPLLRPRESAPNPIIELVVPPPPGGGSSSGGSGSSSGGSGSSFGGSGSSFGGSGSSSGGL